MNSGVLKTEAMCWLRYGKRMPIVATEAGHFSADVLGISRDMSIEIEVKVSKADLKRDFDKVAKHLHYEKGTSSSPSFFYFFVPEELVETAEALVKEKAPKYGIAVYNPGAGMAGKCTRIHKKPQRLNPDPPSHRYVHTALMRMSSELCGMHLAFDTVSDNLLERLKKIPELVLQVAVRAAGTLDHENETSFNVRAAELANCVDGSEWHSLNEEQQDKWKAATRRLLDAQYLDNHDIVHGWAK